MLPRIKRRAKSVLGVMPPQVRRLARSISLVTRPNAHRGKLRPDLRKPVPFWSLVLILLLGSGSGIVASAMWGQISSETSPVEIPDFTIASTPASQNLAQGSLATFNVDMTSLGGFAGSVTLSATISPTASNTSIALNPVAVSLFTGSGTSRLTLSADLATPTGSYGLTVNGTSGRLSHAVVVFVTVTPPPSPDFAITATPFALTINAGSSGASTILVTSLNGFAGTVTLTTTVLPVVSNGPALTLNPTIVTLAGGGTQGSSLVVTTVGNTPRIDYTILVVGTSGSVSHSFVISLTVR